MTKDAKNIVKKDIKKYTELAEYTRDKENVESYIKIVKFLKKIIVVGLFFIVFMFLALWLTGRLTEDTSLFNELFVCIVDSTKCPVIEALTAIWAVSESLISPIIMILGSCLKILLKTVAKSSPISLFT